MSDYTTSSTSYPNAAAAHRAEFLDWLTAGNSTAEVAIRDALESGATVESLVTECEESGWFADRAWYDRATLVSVVAELLAGEAE